METKYGVRQIIIIICITYVQKDFYIQICIKQLLTKYQILLKFAQTFRYSQKWYSFKYNWKFLDQLFLPYKFYGRDMMGIYFFNFASCEPLKNLDLKRLKCCISGPTVKQQVQKCLILSGR